MRKTGLLALPGLGLCIQFAALINVIWPDSQPAVQILRHIKCVLFAAVRKVFILRMLGYIEFVAKKGADALHLQDTLAAVHDSQFVRGHQLFTQLLIVDAHTPLTATGI